MDIAVIGSGYVGLVAGACFAELGNSVICVDNNAEKIEMLKKGVIPIYEPGLEEVVKRNSAAGRLSFTTELPEAVKKSEIVFIAVGTPSTKDGDADLSFVENVAKQIANAIEHYTIVVEKSTVPVETGERIAEIISSRNTDASLFDVVSNPEFLREGSAIEDFMHPDRVVIGSSSAKALEKMSELYAPLNAPVLRTDIRSAEIIKHASNSFLATKISFINAIANICEKTGGDIKKIAEGIGLDKRIGDKFLKAGIGYGGSCFPKDVRAFIKIAAKNGYDFKLLREVEVLNNWQRKQFARKIESALGGVRGKTVAILGLAFKPNTDDMRDAPSIDVIKSLQEKGARIKAYDPVAAETAKKILPDIEYCANAYAAVRGADAAAICTDWNEFKEMDLLRIKSLMKQPVIVDGRLIFEPSKLKELGFNYICIGRKMP